MNHGIIHEKTVKMGSVENENCKLTLLYDKLVTVYCELNLITDQVPELLYNLEWFF